MTKFCVSSRLLGTVFGVAFSAGLGLSSNAEAAGVGGWFSSMLGQSGGENMNVDETLRKMSEKMNRKMPQAIDKDTRLDKVSADSGHQFSYHYTMLNVPGKDVSATSFYKTFKPALQKRVCAAEDLKMFFRNRITVAYAYQGMDGKDIGKLAFSPKDCGYAG